MKTAREQFQIVTPEITSKLQREKGTLTMKKYGTHLENQMTNSRTDVIMSPEVMY